MRAPLFYFLTYVVLRKHGLWLDLRGKAGQMFTCALCVS